MRGERCGEGVELVALVAAEAARGDHFLDVRVGRVRGEGGAGAEEDRDEAAAGVNNRRPELPGCRLWSTDSGEACGHAKIMRSARRRSRALVATRRRRPFGRLRVWVP